MSSRLMKIIIQSYELIDAAQTRLISSTSIIFYNKLLAGVIDMKKEIDRMHVILLTNGVMREYF